MVASQPAQQDMPAESKWHIKELYILTAKLHEALSLPNGLVRDYHLDQAANAMELFSRYVRPDRQNLQKDAERVVDALKAVRDTLDEIDSETLQEFARLSSLGE